MHGFLVRSKCPSQNLQNTSVSERFSKVRCRKNARLFGGKHISKAKITKHLPVGALLEVEMSKKCTPLWCEAHFQVKNWGGLDHCWMFRCSFAWQGQGIVNLPKSEQNVRFCSSFNYNYNFNYSTLHHTTLRYTPLHYEPHYRTTLHYTPLHCTALR